MKTISKYDGTLLRASPGQGRKKGFNFLSIIRRGGVLSGEAASIAIVKDG